MKKDKLGSDGVGIVEYIFIMLATAVVTLAGLGALRGLGCMIVATIRVITSVILGVIAWLVYVNQVLPRYESLPDLAWWHFVLGIIVLFTLVKWPRVTLNLTTTEG